ncbi:hypothetical protein AB0D97_12790 [Streptomyces roseus]|uniref:hypothetical protein n=1 Tax=Streptomyces roseus TaxID=66430 RepID=UPI0033DDDDCD
MTINHRAEAERHLSKASFMTGDGPSATPVNPAAADFHLRAAQVHATLAAGETQAMDTASHRATIIAYRYALVRQIAEGLGLSETDEAHQHAKGLGRHLDDIGHNLDTEVEHYLTKYVGMDSKTALKAPSVRRAERDALPDPWAVGNGPF